MLEHSVGMYRLVANCISHNLCMRCLARYTFYRAVISMGLCVLFTTLFQTTAIFDIWLF